MSTYIFAIMHLALLMLVQWCSCKVFR